MSVRARFFLAGVGVLLLLGISGPAPHPRAATGTAGRAGPLRIMPTTSSMVRPTRRVRSRRAIPGQPPFPDCNLDLQASIDVMRAHDPDIIGVQEVDRFWARSANVDEPAVLAGARHGSLLLRRQPRSSAGHPLDVPHQYGTVIISRFPILDCSNTLLRRTGTNEQRGLTRALINVRGVPLQFYNTHLHTTAADRLMQTADIAAVSTPRRPG